MHRAELRADKQVHTYPISPHLLPPGHMTDMERSLVEVSQEEHSSCGLALSMDTDQAVLWPVSKVLDR